MYVRAHINKILGNTQIGRERKSKRSPARSRSRSIAFSSSRREKRARSVSSCDFWSSDHGTRRGKEDWKNALATSEFALRSVCRTSLSCQWRDAFPRCDVFPRRRSRLWYARFPRESCFANDDVQLSIMCREGERDRKHLRSVMES